MLELQKARYTSGTCIAINNMGAHSERRGQQQRIQHDHTTQDLTQLHSWALRLLTSVLKTQYMYSLAWKLVWFCTDLNACPVKLCCQYDMASCSSTSPVMPDQTRSAITLPPNYLPAPKKMSGFGPPLALWDRTYKPYCRSEYTVYYINILQHTLQCGFEELRRHLRNLWLLDGSQARLPTQRNSIRLICGWIWAALDGHDWSWCTLPLRRADSTTSICWWPHHYVYNSSKPAEAACSLQLAACSLQLAACSLQTHCNSSVIKGNSVSIRQRPKWLRLDQKLHVKLLSSNAMKWSEWSLTSILGLNFMWQKIWHMASHSLSLLQKMHSIKRRCPLLPISDPGL